MAAPSQNFIPIKQLREGVMLMEDQSMKGILLVSSMNFALKSEEEQGAVIFNFQNFLNSLDFSCQIIVNSRKVNITGYIDKIKELEANQKNELLKIQTSDYRKFIEELVGSGSIMNKSFYVVVPYFPLVELGGTVPATQKKGTPQAVKLSEESFQKGKYQLWQRMEYVSLGLRRCGLKSVAMGSEEVLELLWSLHYPKQAEMGYYPELPPEIIT
jgi:coenzyme F420-reducing hydrogenase alpha subunit